MDNTREKLSELPIDDAILILKEELKQRADGYTTYLANGGKGDPAEEVNLDALEMAISALEQTKWIPVTERLPEKTGRYLTANIRADDERCVFDLWFECGEWYIDEGDDLFIYKVTHWMPLPDPPKCDT
jgi:5-hydroxyisourate hydrolase-like protein (transthyretin family)